MVKFWKGTMPEADFETQQAKLRRLSGEVLKRYQRELEVEVRDPQLLAETYGKAFASSDARRQAEVVAEMATQMLGVPNAMVNVMNPDKGIQDSIAYIHDDKVEAMSPALIQDSYCQHVIGTGRPLAVEDAMNHPLVCDSVLAREGIVVSYLGVPVASRGGMIVGSLCVYEATQRDWKTADVGMLTQLSMVLTRSLG